MRKATVWKIAAIAAVVATLLWIDFTYLKTNPESIREWMLSFGWLAPALYIAIYIVRPFVLFPASVLSMAGGLAFGTWHGIVYTLAGEVTGAVLSFLLARKIGAGFFREKQGPRLEKLERTMNRRGFAMVLMLRIAPFVPFDLVSYAAGAARVPLRAYLPATILGTLPGTFAYCFLGASLGKGNWKDLAIAGIVFAFAIAVPFLFRRKVEQERNESSGAELQGDRYRAR